jgi:hypothetical protein
MAAAGAGSSHISTLGSRAATDWLTARKIPRPDSRWSVEIAMDVRDTPAVAKFDERRATRFHLDIYSEEWGFLFCHGGRLSRIRITDIAFIHGRDDHKLLPATPTLANVSWLVQIVEREHGVKFRRDLALIQTDLAQAEPAIRQWLLGL